MSKITVPHDVQAKVDQAVYDRINNFPTELHAEFGAEDDTMISEAYARTLRKIRRVLPRVE